MHGSMNIKFKKKRQYLNLETVVLTFVYCIVLCSLVLFLCHVFFFSDEFHVQLLCDRICGPTK